MEVAACEELPWLLGAGSGPTEAELEAIRRATFTVAAVDERERTTDHDMAAFVDVLAASAGEAGRWIHYGLTSSDVLDTALALQLNAAGEVIVPGARALVRRWRRARASTRRRCAWGARTACTPSPRHSGSSSRASRSRRTATRCAWSARLRRSRSARSRARWARTRRPAPSSRRACWRASGLAREPVSTQVVARDRHAELLSAIALAGAGMERLATEVRHLQRTEVREAQEPFRAGQKGSSAMPHKRNPIKSEQIAGLARVLRGNAQAGLENVALWHERDISHSSVERIVLADSTTLIDYLQHRAIALVEGMTVDAERMRANLELTHGAIFSQRCCWRWSRAGMSRDDAYYSVQRAAQQAWDTGTPLRELLAADGGAHRRARPRRDLRLRALRALRAGDRGAAGRDRVRGAQGPVFDRTPADAIGADEIAPLKRTTAGAEMGAPKLPYLVSVSRAVAGKSNKFWTE